MFARLKQKTIEDKGQSSLPRPPHATPISLQKGPSGTLEHNNDHHDSVVSETSQSNDQKQTFDASDGDQVTREKDKNDSIISINEYHTPSSTPLNTPSNTSMTSNNDGEASTDVSMATVDSTPSRTSISDDQQEKFDQLSRDDLMMMIQKRQKIALRYKTRFTELMESYKKLEAVLQEKEASVVSIEKKYQRKLSEANEAHELDRQAKAHMEETFRLALEEKEEKIAVMQTQVRLLKERQATLHEESHIKGRPVITSCHSVITVT
jgi:hypothetical protein